MEEEERSSRRSRKTIDRDRQAGHDRLWNDDFSPEEMYPPKKFRRRVFRDAVDDYVQISKSSANQCLEKFGEDVITIFRDQYLRSLNSSDIQRLSQMGEARGFPGLLRYCTWSCTVLEEV
ncbi:hypothetical protein CRG98_029221 [Punica granatum]|uniref:Uncharacterized protein n=1 Tax=Punica granatum TaxID=22663 RepID=A0A2I0J2U7_PUNGR|nr:hypothetical protein CRG98_029221 [Punica granatum]